MNQTVVRAEQASLDRPETESLVEPVSVGVGGQRLGFRPVERRLFGPDDCLVHRLERAEWEARS